jgi:hypothetical protein
MAEKLSTTLTNAQRIPMRLTPTFIHRGRIRESVAMIAVETTDKAGDIYRLTRVPSEARVSEVIVNHQAIAGLAANIGLYKPNYAGGQVVNDSLFGGGHTFTSAELNAVIAPQKAADVEKQIWELLGLEADPHAEYDFCLTLTAPPTAAGNLAVRFKYVDGN